MHLLLVLQKVLPCHVLIGPQLFLLSTGQQCPVITNHGASAACRMISDVVSHHAACLQAVLPSVGYCYLPVALLGAVVLTGSAQAVALHALLADNTQEVAVLRLLCLVTPCGSTVVL